MTGDPSARDRRPDTRGGAAAAPAARGCVVWLTGPPSAGKTTLARSVEEELVRRQVLVEVLDGDEIRPVLSRELGFTRGDRDTNVLRVAYVAQLLQRNGVIVLAALVSPYRASREQARALIGRYLEVYVECSLDECIRRDVKGLYKKALAGEIKNFTGISDPYEPPTDPDVVVATDREAPEKCVAKIIEALEARGYVCPAEPA